MTGGTLGGSSTTQVPWAHLDCARVYMGLQHIYPGARLLLAICLPTSPLPNIPHSREEYLALPGRALLKGWRGPVLAAVAAAFLAAARASAIVGLRLVL